MADSSWESLVYPQVKSICYISSSIFLFYLFSLIVLVVFWKYVQKRVLLVSTIILTFGFIAFGLLQNVCYIDFLVEIMRCQIYSRLITILGNSIHVVFDLYQIQKILPLVGTVFSRPKPLIIMSWNLLAIRLGCFIAECILQNPAIAPPVGGFRTPGYGICFNSVNRVDRELYIGIKVGSFLFELLLFGQLVFIIYRLKKSSDRRRSIPTERLLDIELYLFGFYFIMDPFFLIMFLVPNAGFTYSVSAILYNAVLPSIVVANIFAIRWARLRQEAPIDLPPARSEEAGTTPTQRDSQSYQITSINPSRYSPTSKPEEIAVLIKNHKN